VLCYKQVEYWDPPFPSLTSSPTLPRHALRQRLRLQFPLRLLEVLRCVDTMLQPSSDLSRCQRTLCSTYLVVVHKVEHGHDVQKHAGISRVPRRHTLHIVRELCGSVQRLAALNPIDHLAHVLVDFPLVFCHAVESHCVRSISLNILLLNPEPPLQQVVGVLILQGKDVLIDLW